MNRREFVKRGVLAAGGAAIMPATLSGCSAPSAPKPAPAAKAEPKQEGGWKRAWRLKYAPRLDFLRKLREEERLEKFASYGFTATEFNGLTRVSERRAEEIRKKLDELKMEMGIFVANLSGWEKGRLTDPETTKVSLEELKVALRYHEIIGNNRCTVLAGNESKDVPREVQKRHLIDGLKRMADILEGTKLTIVVEPLNPINHGGYFLVLSKEADEVMKAVGSPHVKFLFDIYHQQISEGNLINNINSWWDQIGYFQVGDVPGRREPLTGEINYRSVFKAIHEKGYGGIVGMEHGLSGGDSEEGLAKCFDAYKWCDSW